jgi:integrase
MSVIELTPKLVKSASCPIGKQKVDIYDSYCKGLLLEIRITGGKTYSLIYTDSRGKRRQFKLADERDVTLTQARKLADKLRGEIAMGEDPFAQKTALRNVPKLEDFVANYFVPYIKQYKRGWKTNVSMLNNHILPEFGSLFLDEITLSDVIKLHCAMRDKGYAAVTCNNAVIMMRYMFNLAKKWGFKGVENNPSAGFALFEVNNQRERYLSRSEVQLLKNAINESENTQLKYIVVLLLFTGCRKRELLDAKWEHMDIDKRIWRIPTTKSGKLRHVPLSDIVIDILQNLPRFDDCPYILPNPQTQKPYNTIYYSWNTARNRADMPDLRMHDLRHSFASFLINSGRSLYEVQNILGHSQISSTQRYAHLSETTLVAAANAAASAAN